jgi:arylsulfatase/arylsulfatase A
MTETARPNVVLIIMDDLAYGDLSSHGNPYTQTPNIDRVGTGARMTRSCSGPLCTPARASIMTGRHPFRTRAFDTYCGRTTMDPDEITVAQVLRDAGYRTCISGKWHLGDTYPSRAMDLGFDEALVHNGGGLRQPANPGHWLGWDAYDDPYLLHNGTVEQHQGYCTDIFTDHAMTFIRDGGETPFFCYLATNAPHGPLEVGDEWSQRFFDLGLSEKEAKLYGMVENIDMNVGRLFACLEETGQLDNTIVIFTSDHGPCGSAQVDGRTRYNCDLRGGKASMYQGGTKVPYLWHWPAGIRPGTEIDRVMGPIDVLPTLAEACGATVPSDRTIDGVSLVPLLTGAVAQDDWPARTLFLQWQRGNVPQRFLNCQAQDQQYKLVDGVALYDLIADPNETTDISAAKPDVVARLRRAYDDWFDDVSRERPDNFEAPPAVVGTAHESPLMLNRNDRRPHGPDAWIEDQSMGHWVVRFAKAPGSSYTVRAEFPQLASDGVLHVYGGGAYATVPAPAGSAEAAVAILPDAGDGLIEGWVTAGADRWGARFLHIS